MHAVQRGPVHAALRLLVILAVCAGGLIVDARAAPRSDAVVREPFDSRSIGSPADVCRNFFAYANGAHKKALLTGASSLETLNAEMDIRTDTLIHQILIRAGRTGKAGSETRKLATLYSTCMDDDAIERQGLAPIASELSAIEAMRRARDLIPEIARLHDIGVDVAFGFGPMQAYNSPASTIGEIAQSGLGLPDREYYRRTDSPSRRAQTEYQAYLSALLAASGRHAGASSIAAVIALETRFAQASMSTTDLQQPRLLDHPMTLRAISLLTPHITLRRYLAAEGMAAIGRINVAQPAFVQAVDRAISEVPLRTWKDYFRSRLLDTFGPALPQRFSSEYFAFHISLPGDDEAVPFPRWERCVDSANKLLGDAVGEAYVKDVYPAALQSAAVALAVRIKTAFRDELENRAWASARTKRDALAKLDAMRLNIGYPQRRRNYQFYAVRSDSYAANVARGARFERALELNTIALPVNRTLWPDPQTMPQTVNADSDMQRNEITVPAAMFAWPNFDAAGDDAANLGAMGGGIIGHEMMHEFDDVGHQFDAAGKLRNWWAPQDLARLEAGERCVAAQVGRINVGGGHYNGRLVAGEAIADLGGVIVGYRALRTSLARRGGKRIDGYTPEQRYFLAFAQSFGNDLEFDSGAPDMQVLLDEHPLARDRVNATLANVPAWYEAFGCAQPHRPVCDVW